MTEQVKSLTASGVYKRLLSYTVKYWRVFLIALFGMIALALTEVAFAYFMQPLVDDTFGERNIETIKWIPYVVILIFGVKIIGNFLATYFMAYIARNVIFTLRKQMFDKILRLPVSYFDNESSGNVVSKMVFNVEQLGDAVTNVVTVIIKDSLAILVLLAYLFYLNAKLAGFLLLIIPLLAVVVAYVSKRFRKLSLRIQDSIGDISNVSKEAVEASREVKIFCGAEHETREFNKVNANNRRQFLKNFITMAVSSPIIEFIVACAFAGILYFVTQPDMIVQLSAGKFIAFIVAMLLLLQHARPLTAINSALQRGIAAAQSIFEFLDHGDEEDNGTKTIHKVKGNIEFVDVNFSYNNKDSTLNNINLSVAAGESLAFVGQSGAGKTTIVNLIPRFYDIEKGKILIDGHDIQTLTLGSLRSNISLVSQHVTLFNDTIAHNIAYGALDNASIENIKNAAKSANALEFIEKLPDGFNTVVGENGVLLSGGQRQRLAIARAILKDAPILILDEATSALDTESEQLIQTAMNELMRDRTTLVIAHRLSTVKQVNNIVVMKDGEIIEQGKHQELLDSDGAYTRLHSFQFANDPEKT